MKEQLSKAHHSALFLKDEIRDAHAAAVAAGNQFAEIAIFDLISEAVALEQKVKRLLEASEND